MKDHILNGGLFRIQDDPHSYLFDKGKIFRIGGGNSKFFIYFGEGVIDGTFLVVDFITSTPIFGTAVESPCRIAIGINKFKKSQRK